MEHLYGSLFKTTEGAYGPLSSYGVVWFRDIDDARYVIYDPSDWENGTWDYQPPHSLLLPRGLI